MMLSETPGMILVLLVGLSNAHPQYNPGGGDGGSDPVTITICEPYTHDCVPYYQCKDGVINTDGSGLLDLRIKPPTSQCTNNNYPDVPGLCCRIPGATTPPPAPLQTCPGGQVCVIQEQCKADGTVNTDGSHNIDVRINTRCYVTPGSQTTIGVCCQPPPLDTCPSPQVCLTQDKCSAGTSVQGTATTTYSKCFINKANYETGVCCEPPIKLIDICPGESLCLPQTLCRGEILTDIKTNTYVSYDGAGTWEKCSLNGDVQNPGVCCRNPVVTEPPYKPADKCGVRNLPLDLRTQAKLNKNEAFFGEFPWQAVLFFSNFTFKCGASLVADKWLVTGAHCVNGFGPGDLKIRLGEWQVDRYDEILPYIDVDIAAITVHPKFNNQNLHNNVAVIELAAPVKLQYHINTVCLPTPQNVLSAGTRCFATGWGKDAFDGQYQPILKKVDIPFVEHGHCQNLLRLTRLGKYFVLDNSLMCAGGEENQDACTGDGGGPLVCQDPTTNSYILWGITSFGISCGQKDVPGVYADVQFFADWISNVIYGTPVNQVTQPGNPYGRK